MHVIDNLCAADSKQLSICHWLGHHESARLRDEALKHTSKYKYPFP